MAMLEDIRNAALSTGGALWRGAMERSGVSRSELARRTALARQPGPEGIAGPPLRLLLGELRAVWPKALGQTARSSPSRSRSGGPAIPSGPG